MNSVRLILQKMLETAELDVVRLQEFKGKPIMCTIVELNNANKRWKPD